MIINGSFSGGLLTANGSVADFPSGFKPDTLSNYTAVCSLGVFQGEMSISGETLGRLRISSANDSPSNVGAFQGRFNSRVIYARAFLASS